MGLKNCTDCGKLISETAYFCVSCGLPFIKLEDVTLFCCDLIYKNYKSNYDINENIKSTYTVKDIKQILDIGINQAYELAESGQFPIVRVGKGGKIVIPMKPFNEWLLDNKCNPELFTAILNENISPYFHYQTKIIKKSTVIP